MAAYETRTKTTVRHEFVLPNPTNWAELSKAVTAIEHDLKANGMDASYDDVVTVAATEEEIILSWEEIPVEAAR